MYKTQILRYPDTEHRLAQDTEIFGRDTEISDRARWGGGGGTGRGRTELPDKEIPRYEIRDQVRRRREGGAAINSQTKKFIKKRALYNPRFS